MENTLTAAELKRRGMAAIEEGLRRGPVRLMKRNQAAAVVLSASDYQKLISAQSKKIPGMTALEWLMTAKMPGGRSKRELDKALAQERNW